MLPGSKDHRHRVMQLLKRFMEWYLGVPRSDSGQGSAWHLNATPPWPSGLPDWGVLLLGLALCGYVVSVYLRDAKSLSGPVCAVLIGLRLSSIAVLVLFLTSLTLSVDRTGLPVVVVLVDVSASMGLEDRYPDQILQRQIEQLISEGRFKAATRLNLAKAVLLRRNGSFLKRLLRKHKLRIYRFSDTASAVGRGEYLNAGEIDELIPLLRGLEAVGDETRPGPSVRKVFEDLRGTPPSAVILLTDGITSTTDADKLSGIIDLASSNLVPIFTIGIGSAEPSRDVQLYDILVNEVAFVDDLILMSAKLKTYGIPAGKPISVVLRGENSNAVLVRKQIPAGEEGQPVKVEFRYTPRVAGEFDYTLEAQPLADESNRNNNSETRHVSVREARIRVLLVDSVPRYEFRYVKHLLEREKTVELHTVLQEADVEYSTEDETALDHFPVRREELFKYDVIIWGDVNPSYLSSGVFENLDEFVRDVGGGLLVVAGPFHNPLSYRGTPLEILLPINLEGVAAPSAEIPIVEGFRPRLTIGGRKETPIFRFAETEQESLKIWNHLPKLYWLWEARELAEGARVYAEHPTRDGAKGKLPVIVKHRVGAGTVLFHATDELWRWRFRVGDLYYGRYWVQAVRFLSRSKLIGRDRTAQLSADRLIYRRGETISLRIKFHDERLAPIEDDGVSVVVERRGDVQRTVTLNRLPEVPSVFEGQIIRPAEGSYHAWVVAPAFNEAPPSTDFRVEAPLRELERRRLDRAELTETAERTEGKSYTPGDADRLPADLPPGLAVPLETLDPIPLWNRWKIVLPCLFLFTLLLLAEWLLRKRFRLI